MMNPLGMSRENQSESIAHLKNLVRDIFQLSEDDTILVTELRCQEDDCPDVETVIAVLGEPGKARKHKLLKSVHDITSDDILSLAARGTHG